MNNSAPVDDCFAFGNRPISVTEALTHLRERSKPIVNVERCGLADAQGRFLSGPVVAPEAFPPFTNVAVDGFAFRARDLTGERMTRLSLVKAKAAAGHPYPARLQPGEAVEVRTGALLPEGADTVVFAEASRLEGETVLVPSSARPGANCRPAGEDIKAGQTLFGSGHRLRAQDVGLLAEVCVSDIPVFRRLRVALASTGDELVAPGEERGPGQISDVNRLILMPLIRGLGMEVSDLGILRDDRTAVRKTLFGAAESHDAIVTSGGASASSEDHVARAIREAGELAFWRIAMKPGRPLAFGQLGQSQIYGLPGNPVAAMVCFLRFARPSLIALAGGGWSEPDRFPLPAAFAFESKPDRTELLRATVRREADGSASAVWIAKQGSGMLSSMTDATGLIEIDAATTRVMPGDRVDFLPFSAFGI
ncbi:MAG: gephyrin-like molybdotransferase Glp [Geminicoccaceae bacterium]